MNNEEQQAATGHHRQVPAMDERARASTRAPPATSRARYGDILLITPSASPYEALAPEMIADHAAPPASTACVDGTAEASTEWRFHYDIMRPRPDVGAHRARSFDLLHRAGDLRAGRSRRALHDRRGRGRPDHPLATMPPTAPSELSENALKALDGRTCCLLANHGMIATGADLDRAMWLAVELETVARQYYLTPGHAAAPRFCPTARSPIVMERFRDYGPRGKAAPAPEIAAGAIAGRRPGEDPGEGPASRQ